MTSGPVIGQTWDPIIDHSTFVPGATMDFMLLSGRPADSALSGIATGNLLCSLPAFRVLQSAPGTAFSVPIPNTASLVGVNVCTQGLSVDGGMPAVHFANALDIVIGDAR